MAFIKTDLTIIYCDSRRRDSTVAILLQELLKKRGQLSFVASRRNFSKILKLATPANIVMIGQINIVYDLVYDGKTLKDRFKDTNIYFYPSEGYATDNEYHMMYPERFNYRDTKKIFFWGRESLEWVRRHLDIAPETLDNTGYPRTRRNAGGNERRRFGCASASHARRCRLTCPARSGNVARVRAV